MNKKNLFWFTKNGNGIYFNEYFKDSPSSKEYVKAGIEYQVLETLLALPQKVYQVNHKIEFDKNASVPFTEIEKETFTKVIRRLEKDAQDKKKLEDKLEQIFIISDTRKF